MGECDWALRLAHDRAAGLERDGVMHCSELERFLEACLDGELGESRRITLLQHLALCRQCNERVEGLRRFEADLQRRLRAMQHEASLWQPLDLAVVGGDRPIDPPIDQKGPATGPGGRFAKPPEAPVDGPLRAQPALPAPRRPLAKPPAHRMRRTAPVSITRGRRVQGLVGATLLVAAVAALSDLAFGLFSGERPEADYRAYLAGEVELDLLTSEPDRLETWLAERLGEPVELPKAAGAFTLLGGTAKADLPIGDGLAVYDSAAGPAVLSIAAAGDPLSTLTSEPELLVEDGLTSMKWQAGEHAYSLVSALPPDKLSLFAAR